MNLLGQYKYMQKCVREALAQPESPLNQWWEEYMKAHPIDWEKLREEAKE
jgi:hypothetical protein